MEKENKEKEELKKQLLKQCEARSKEDFWKI
jgi:hypothetical protein